jgi:hypothetical protein
MPPSHRATDGRRARGETCTGTRGASVGNGSNAEANCAGPWSVFCASRLSAGFLLHKSPSCCRMLWSIGRRSDLGLWVEFAGVPRKHSRQGLYRIHHGGRRTAVDDHLLPRRLASPACWRWRISLGTPRLSGCRRGADYRLHCAVDLPYRARLPLRVSNSPARARSIFRRGDQPSRRRCARAVACRSYWSCTRGRPECFLKPC